MEEQILLEYHKTMNHCKQTQNKDPDYRMVNQENKFPK